MYIIYIYIYILDMYLQIATNYNSNCYTMRSSIDTFQILMPCAAFIISAMSLLNVESYVFY